ncbi:hypothetical protein [Alicyclobacillus pomorum]|nr:hypothetical protein [Alicyclobacillus pomorum]
MKWTKRVLGLVAFATLFATSFAVVAEAGIFIPTVPEPMVGYQTTHLP